MVQLGLLALRFLSGRLSCSGGEEGGETGAWAEGMGREGGAEEEGWLGGTVGCLETSCSFDLLVSPVVAGSACLTGLQLSSVFSFSSGRPGFTTLLFLSSLSAVSPHFELLSSVLCLSGLSLSLFFSTFPLSVLSSSLHTSSLLCLSSLSFPCLDFPAFPFSFFFFLTISFLLSLFALSPADLSRFDFLSFRFSFFAFFSLSLFFSSGGCREGS